MRICDRRHSPDVSLQAQTNPPTLVDLKRSPADPFTYSRMWRDRGSRQAQPGMEQTLINHVHSGWLVAGAEPLISKVGVVGS